MDPAEVERLAEILRTQEARLIRQEEFQTAMAANMGHLFSQLQDLLGQLAQPGAAAQQRSLPQLLPRLSAEPAVSWLRQPSIPVHLGCAKYF
ncbi:hypothetical protein N1851_017709 [Merluccius polli]|nr:hypothetical protein N1851_017709 [Merluccius polli]